jgi:hypothetical protein
LFDAHLTQRFQVGDKISHGLQDFRCCRNHRSTRSVVPLHSVW